MDGVSGSDCIENIFKNKFENVYNNNVTDISGLQSLENDIEQHIMFRSSPTDYVITVKQINDGIESLAKGKSDGDTGMLTDNIVNSPQLCSVMLSFWFLSMLIHGYLSDELSKSVIVQSNF